MQNLLAQRAPINGVEYVNDVATLQGFEWIFSNILNVALAFGGIVLFIVLLIGGFTLLTSGDSAEKAASAKKTITYAVLGLVLVALAYFILNLVADITGANITIFKVVQ